MSLIKEVSQLKKLSVTKLGAIDNDQEKAN